MSLRLVSQSAIAWIIFYHVILRPFNLMPADDYMTKRYEGAGLVPRFSYFKVYT